TPTCSNSEYRSSERTVFNCSGLISSSSSRFQILHIVHLELQLSIIFRFKTVGFEELSKIGAGNVCSFPKYNFLRNRNSRLYLESFLRPFSFNLYSLYFSPIKDWSIEF